MKDFVGRWRDVLMRIGTLPVSFLGVGLYRAWLSTFFRYEAFPTVGFFDYALFEGAIGVASFAVVACARRLVPLWRNRKLVRLTAVSMVGGSTLVVIACFGVPVAALKYAGLVLAGIGLALLILMWAEFFGSLNPMRVAVYYAGAIVLGECFKWVFTGLEPAHIAVFSVVLPLVSIDWVRRSMRRLPELDLPKPMGKPQLSEVPWKPVLLMGVCTLATGFGVLPDKPLVAGNIVGTVLMALFVFFGVLSSSKWFNFDTMYQLAFPFMTVGLLLIVPQFSLDSQTAAACYDAGYTMLSLLIVLVLSNITYRFGIAAAWLNGIERGIRYLVEALGWGAFALGSAFLTQEQMSALHIGIVAAVVVAFAVLFLSEKRLSAKWGINLKGDLGEDDVFSPGVLAMRVSDLSHDCNLSPREEEVLQLLARRETAAQISEKLFVAPGTVKAHTSRIYRKLGVRSREELYELFGQGE